MRIIDNKQDFYDYLQSDDDNLVFDRRNSFVLTKELFLDHFKFSRNLNVAFVLLQCGNSFWLFLAVFTEYSNYGNPIKYELELLRFWKNYNKPRTCISLHSITLHSLLGYNAKNYNVESIRKIADKIKDSIDTDNFKYDVNLGEYTKITDYKESFKKELKTIPLLKACGIANLVNPLDVFCAIEEYFSLDKTQSETTEPKGETNDDKIIMHGFDVKTSFRGK